MYLGEAVGQYYHLSSYILNGIKIYPPSVPTYCPKDNVISQNRNYFNGNLKFISHFKIISYHISRRLFLCKDIILKVG
jgi:hypothetical protein